MLKPVTAWEWARTRLVSSVATDSAPPFKFTAVPGVSQIVIVPETDMDPTVMVRMPVSPAAKALDQIPRHGVLPRVTAAEPPNRAIDQILQFVVGNSHFL